MTQATNNLAAYIWSLADLLRGDFKQSQYGRVILPFTLLRRLEGVLEESKQAVLTEHEKIQKMDLPEEAQEKMILRVTGGLSFFNISKMDLSKLGETGIKANRLNPIFKAFQRMLGRYLNTSSLMNLLASWAMPTCCIRWYRRSGIQILALRLFPTMKWA